ncbi:serine hydrolase domain-containing protein [Streptomyces sp. NPDC046900]|uniref:serine hydrolase domain-containing protein n=1 Tax=Streptomyces sp. NPDC046900 TaxID=3155473 RepID=UPI0033FEB97B
MRLPLLAAATVLSGALAVPAAVPAFADSAPPAAAAPYSAAAHRPGVADHAAWKKALDDLVAAGVPGVIAEVHDAHGTWTGTSGRGDVHHRQLPSIDGRFRAGSNTKTFVATTVLQLVAEKKVRLDTPIERYLPGLVPNGQHITVRQLLSHRSGLFDYTDSLWHGNLSELYQTRFRHWTPPQLLAEAFRHAPYFAPGTAGHYSNTNYIVLGMLIQKVTGKSTEQEITDRLIKPLGLHHTSFPGSSVRIPGPHAHGYLRMNGPGSPYTDITEESMSWASTAGSLISTTHDLNRFFSALIGGKLLPPALLHQMQDAQPLQNGATDYGLGLSRLTDPSYGTAYGHIGSAPGYNTYSFTTADNSRQVTLSLNVLIDSQKLKTATNKALKTLLRPTATPEHARPGR